MNWEPWALVGVSAIIIPSVGWLVKAVLTLKRDMLALQLELKNQCENWTSSQARRDLEYMRNQQWNQETQRTLERVDRNMVRLCEKTGANFEAP
jgi:hypothetical protein